MGRSPILARPAAGGRKNRDSYPTAQALEGGGVRLMVKGVPVTGTREVGTDFRALVDGYVSVGKVNNIGIV